MTMEKEVKYIWPAPWRVGKCLYIATKYLSLVDAAMLCYGTLSTSRIFVLIHRSAAQFILHLRRYFPALVHFYIGYRAVSLSAAVLKTKIKHLMCLPQD